MKKIMLTIGGILLVESGLGMELLVSDNYCANVGKQVAKVDDCYCANDDMQAAKQFIDEMKRYYQKKASLWNYFGISDFKKGMRYFSMIRKEPENSNSTSPFKISLEDFIINIYQAYVLYGRDGLDSLPYSYAQKLVSSDAFERLPENSPLRSIKGDLLYRLALDTPFNRFKGQSENKNRENLLRDAVILGHGGAIVELMKQLLLSSPLNRDSKGEIKELLTKAIDTCDISSFIDALNTKKEELLSLKWALYRLYLVKNEEDIGHMRRQILEILDVLDIWMIIDPSVGKEKEQEKKDIMELDNQILHSLVWGDLSYKRYDIVKARIETSPRPEMIYKVIQDFREMLENCLRSSEKDFDISIKYERYREELRVNFGI